MPTPRLSPRAVRAAGFVVLLAGSLGIAAVKVTLLGYDLRDTWPHRAWSGTVTLEIEGEAAAAWAEVLLPAPVSGSPVTRGYARPGPARFGLRREGGRAAGLWRAPDAEALRSARYTFEAALDPIRYALDPGLLVAPSYPPEAQNYLPQGARAVNTPAVPLLREAFAHAASGAVSSGAVSSGAEPERADARGHAARAFVDSARAAGIPARLVTGYLLAERESRPHRWAEAFAGGRWVPFDPALGLFAEQTSAHLPLARGAVPWVRHARGLTVRPRVRVEQTAGIAAASAKGDGLPLSPFGLWRALEMRGLSLDLVLLVLLFPVASTVVVFARNVVGVQTYGVFLPGLVAVGGLSIGLPFTLASFVFVTMTVGLLHFPLARWGVLYTPKMALMLIGVVGAVLATAWAGAATGWYDISTLSVLPLVILSFTAERFATHLGEDGPAKAARVLVSTLALVAVSYLFVAVRPVQVLMATFPEMLLALAAANLAMGRWIGIRVSEFGRFRWLAGRTNETGRAFYDEVVGINRRNVSVIHPANPRRFFFVANDKVVTKALLEEYGVPTPRTIAVFDEVGGVEARWPEIADLPEFVIKPAKGSAGNAIYVLGPNENGPGWQTPGGTAYGPDDLKRILADIVFGTQSSGVWDRAIVEERVHPHPFFAALYARGLPDVRVILHYGEPLLAMARVPTDASDGKANLHQGALGVGIDLATGRMEDAYNYEGYLSHHPDTGLEFASLTVPYWDRILRISREVAALVPLHYLGIDIVLDRDRGPLVIEINARPGIEIQNVTRKGLRPLAEATGERRVALQMERILSWDKPDRRGKSRRREERRTDDRRTDDRRQGEERRQEDRRKEDLPFDGPDRRQGDRRTGERREGERRQEERRTADRRAGPRRVVEKTMAETEASGATEPPGETAPDLAVASEAAPDAPPPETAPEARPPNA